MTAKCGFLIAVIAFACLAQHVSSQARYVEKDAVDGVGEGRYIVTLKDGTDVGTFAQQIKDSAQCTEPESCEILREYPNLHGLAVKLTEDAKTMIMEDSNVELIEDDGKVYTTSRSGPPRSRRPRPQRPRPPPPPPPAVPSWGLDRIDQRDLPLDDVNPPVYQGNGGGVHIYVLDSGISGTHQEFVVSNDDSTSRVTNEFNAFDGGDVAAAICNGHGTHVAATAAGGTYGVAKAATLHDVRVIGCEGNAAESDVISGIDWMLAAGNTVTPAVASMSFGSSKSETLNNAVQMLIDAGIVVSVAAGNSYSDACDHSPASVPEAITVGATVRSDRKAGFSNFGECLDIFAPGVQIKSAWIGTDTATNTIRGTSMACPHVSGAAAILLGEDNALTPADVTAKLIELSTINKVTGSIGSSPNRLLYIGEPVAPPAPPVAVPVV